MGKLCHLGGQRRQIFGQLCGCMAVVPVFCGLGVDLRCIVVFVLCLLLFYFLRSDCVRLDCSFVSRH